MEMIGCSPEQAQEYSDYLHPIWREVYDGLESGGAFASEYFFRKWVSPQTIPDFILDRYEIGYIVADGERIGAYSYKVNENGEFYIGKLYLDHRFRGRGLGQESLRMLESVARQHRCTHMELSVLYFNEAAIKAYTKAGFEPRYRGLTYAGDGVVQNDLIMRKDL